MVPNPYYGFSGYEPNQHSRNVKITNLPSRCEVNIFSIDGKFITQFKRHEIPSTVESPARGLQEKQINPDVEWDLTNSRGIMISSGAYLIHVKELSTGRERILKWFGSTRQ